MISKNRFNPTDGDRKKLFMHAERRIKEHYAQQRGAALDRTMLAGTMRPCGTCASELDLPPDGHRGPFWLSHGGRHNVDIEQLMADDQRNGVGTSVTLTREGALSFEIDTESDSDPEPSSPVNRPPG